MRMTLEELFESKENNEFLVEDFGIRKLDNYLKSFEDEWEIEKLKTERIPYYGGKKSINKRILTNKRTGKKIYIQTERITDVGMGYETEIKITDEPQGFHSTKWYNLAASINTESEIKKAIEKILKKEDVKEIKTGMSDKEFDDLMKDVRSVKSEIEMGGETMTYDMAYDFAGNFLSEYMGLERKINQQGIKDAQGWLADQIMRGGR